MPDRAKFETVMREFASGTLRSSSGKPVTDVKQAQAIAAKEAGYGVKRTKRARKTRMS